MSDVEVYQPPTTSVAHWAREAADAHKLATALVKTSFVPVAYKGKPDEAAACILRGAEIGLTPLAALGSINIISGTPALSAMALRALVQSHGHAIWIEKSNDKEATAKGRRRGEDIDYVSKWTIGRANQLGLGGKDNWKKQPEAMLIARATSEVARMVAADVILGMGYSSEELDDQGDDGPPPARTAQRAKTRKAIEPAPMVETDEPPLDDVEPVAEPAVADDGITRAQMTKLHAAFGNVGWSDRADRLRAASLILGRAVTTSAELTKTEAHTLIDEIEQVATAEDPAGAMVDLMDTLAGAA